MTGNGSSLSPQPEDRELLRLLRRRIGGEPFPHSYIQEADAYSAPPGELVGDREHAPGTDQGDVKDFAWYICSPANCHPSTGGRSTPRRKRNVGGGYWHSEKRKKPVLDADGHTTVGYARSLTYGHKTNRDPPGKGATFKRLGWCMKELGLNRQDGADQLVICKVYRSPRADASVPGAGGDMPPPPAAGCDNNVTERRETTAPADSKYNLHSPAVLGVIRKPPPSTTGFFRPPVGDTTSRVAIVKKADAAEDGGKKRSSSTGSTSVVMKFGGSTIPSADRVKEIAELVLRFPAGAGCSPVLVLSAMGNTTSNLLLAATKALTYGAKNASKLHEFNVTKDLHLRTIDQLGLDSMIVSSSLDELERVLKGVAMMKELTSKTQDYLVSLGERMSASIFSAYLNKLGKGERQEWEPYDVHTCGRGCSNLTATTIGREFESREIQVWKDVNGVLTCDPTICANAKPLPYLTFDEAAELGIFDTESMQLAMEGEIRVTVKDSRNPQAPGTLITKTRDMSKIILTSIVLKSNITMLNIKRKRMLGQSGFLAMSFSILEKLGMLVHCVASSQSKISLITVPSKTSSRELVQLELDNIVEELKEIAVVDRLEDRSVISLIGNAQMSHLILEKVFNVLSNINVKAEMISQASDEVMKLSLVVNDDDAEHCVQALHAAFFENGFVSEAQVAEKERPIPSAAASSSGIKKRKTGDEHHPRGVRQERADTTADCSPSVTERTAFPNNDPIMPEFGGDDYVGVPAELFDIIPDDNHVPVRVDNDGLAAAGVLPQPQAVQPEQPSGVDANHGAQEEYNKLWAFLDHDSPMPVRDDNGAGDPLEWFADILEPDDYPMFDDSGLDNIPMLNAEAEQQGRLAEAAEGGSPLVTEEEEVIEALIAGATPDKFFGSPSSDMSWSPPALASSSSLHVAGECQAAFCGLCFTEEIGI